jgi:hypothetical protein
LSHLKQVDGTKIIDKGGTLMRNIEEKVNEEIERVFGEIKTQSSTYAEAKKLASGLYFSTKNRFEAFIFSEIQRKINEEIDILPIKKG